MTEEEKFVFDLEGYLVIKDVLSPQELDDLNALVDRYINGWDNHPRNDLNKVSSWGQATKDLIDHPKILPYLVELIGPKVRIDHDYAIIMDRGDTRGGLHGGPSQDTDHWFSYRDGQMRNGSERGDLFSRRCQRWRRRLRLRAGQPQDQLSPQPAPRRQAL